MSGPLLAGCIWVLAGVGVAMLPFRRQMIPGFGLLLSAPVILFFIGRAYGWIWVAVGLFAFVSMFRRPLMALARYLGRRMRE